MHLKRKQISIISILALFIICFLIFGDIPFMAQSANIIQLWLKSSKDQSLVSYGNSKGESLLHLAAGRGNKTICRLLLSRENLNGQANRGLTPIHYAALNGHRDVYDFFIEERALILFVTQVSHGNPDVLNALLQMDPTLVNTANRYKRTGLHKVTDNCRGRHNGLKIINLLLAGGADVNARDINGHTPLYNAAYGCDKKACELLLLYGAEPNIHINPKWGAKTPLHAAAVEKKNDIVRLLLDHGANIEAKNSAGMTALVLISKSHRPLRNSDIKTMGVLIEYKADVNAKDNEGYTALHWAVTKGYRHYIQNLFQILFKSGADANARDKLGRTPLHIAVKNANHAGRTNVISFLIENGADINAKDNEGRLPIHYIPLKGHLNTGQALLSKGADINGRDNQGLTVLHQLAQLDCAGDCEKTFDFLVANGADMNAKNNMGRTPLHLSALHGNENFAWMLLENGAKINPKDNEGKTPLRLAIENDKKYVAGLLRQRGGVE